MYKNNGGRTVVSLAILVLTLSACTLTPHVFDDSPLRGPINHDSEAAQIGQAGTVRQQPAQKPKPELKNVQPRGLLSDGGEKVELAESDLKGAFESVPLPEFINKVLGELLGVDFVLAPALERSRDLVTLRVNEALPANKFFGLVEQVLTQYGVGIDVKDGVAFVSPANKGPTGVIPLIISGSTLPDVPDSHRPIFQWVPINVVAADSLVGPIKQVVTDSALKIMSDRKRNALLLRGPVNLVHAAINVSKALDHAWFTGQNLVSYAPDNIGPAELASAIKQVLTAEGVSASDSLTGSGAINMLPQPRFGRLYVFGNDTAMVAHAIEWAEKLDSDAWKGVEEGIFTYAVKNQPANDVAELAEALHSGAEPAASGNEGEASVGTRSFVVDNNQNMLMFRGSGLAWSKLLPILKQIDQPSPSVLVEILIAEVTLSDDTGLGVEWFADRTLSNGYDATFGTLGGLNLGGTAFSLSLNSAGAARSLINAFLQNQRATIRSSPRIMVKSGESASINVGNDIPVLTSRLAADSQSNGNSDIVQQVEYRSTGVNLSVTPTVQGSGLVDLEIAQSLSEAQGAGGISPTILNREINTTLTLQDGGSVLIGGLISTSRTENSVEVPWFAKIPLLGWLFRSRTESQKKTELLLMVVPYVIRNSDQAQELTDSFKSRLGEHVN